MPDDVLKELAAQLPEASGDATSESGLPQDPTAMAATTEQELPEEYKPYAQLPWEKVPEDLRPELLAKVKEFHGTMTKNHQTLRQQAEEFKSKAQWFDDLATQDWFRDAWMRKQQGDTAPPAPPQAAKPPAGDRLAEYGLEKGVGDVLRDLMREHTESALKPYQDQIQNIARVLMERQAADELNEIRAWAKERDLPSPDELSPKLSELIRNGEARSLRAAYRIAVFDDAQTLAATKARKSLETELRTKASKTLPPGGGPSRAPGHEQFTGRDAVLEALRSAESDYYSKGT